ncbi:hypothetical protein HPB50_002700 [Hyalomma asiaticum]|uniref:Uncharacterized protein n=1 Tax=Hyalomma asiaticum TaxID=266040 RepID=A0ACB7TA07_HYAAI|nr:hypothetical protein HPB50_002700 [Hyalomma asiaticum]
MAESAGTKPPAPPAARHGPLTFTKSARRRKVAPPKQSAAAACESGATSSSPFDDDLPSSVHNGGSSMERGQLDGARREELATCAFFFRPMPGPLNRTSWQSAPVCSATSGTGESLLPQPSPDPPFSSLRAGSMPAARFEEGILLRLSPDNLRPIGGRPRLIGGLCICERSLPAALRDAEKRMGRGVAVGAAAVIHFCPRAEDRFGRAASALSGHYTAPRVYHPSQMRWGRSKSPSHLPLLWNSIMASPTGWGPATALEAPWRLREALSPPCIH